MPNWKKVIVSGSNAVLNNITASGHMSVLDDSFTVNTHTQTELEVVGDISASNGTITGNDIVAANNISGSNELEVKYRKLSITSDVTGDFNGDVIFTGNTDVTVGKIYRFSAGSWSEAHNTVADSGTQLLAVALGGNSTTNGMLIRGFVTLADDFGQIGDLLYLGTSGGAQTSPPTGNGHISRLIGTVMHSTNRQIYFNPSIDFIEITT